MRYRNYWIAGVFGLLLFSSCQQTSVDPVNQVDVVPTANEKTGEVIWSYEISSDFDNRVEAAIDGDWAYIQSDTSLAKVELDNGKIVWRVGLGTGKSIASAKVIQDENRVYLNHSSWVKAFDKTSGKLLWETPFDPASSVTIALKKEGPHLLLGRRGEVVQLNASNGQIEQRISLDKLLPEGAVQQVAFDLEAIGEQLYISTVVFPEPGQLPTKAGRIFSYNLNKQAFDWGYEAPNFESINAPGQPKTEDAGVYEIGIYEDLVVGMTSKEVFALDRNTGEEQWIVPFESYKFLKSLVLTKQGGVVVGGRHPYPSPLICLNAKTGKILWETMLEASLLMPPTEHHSWIFISGGSLQIVDPISGNVIWKGYPPEYISDSKAIYLSPVAADKQRLICVGSKRVYALAR